MNAADLPARKAVRHRCTHDISVHCSRGNGKPSRKKCAHCGGQFWVQEGWWGVFVHSSISGNDRYPLDQAESLHSNESAANRRAAQDPTHVVRWLAA